MFLGFLMRVCWSCLLLVTCGLCVPLTKDHGHPDVTSKNSTDGSFLSNLSKSFNHPLISLQYERGAEDQKSSVATGHLPSYATYKLLGKQDGSSLNQTAYKSSTSLEDSSLDQSIVSASAHVFPRSLANPDVKLPDSFVQPKPHAVSSTDATGLSLGVPSEIPVPAPSVLRSGLSYEVPHESIHPWLLNEYPSGLPTSLHYEAPSYVLPPHGNGEESGFPVGSHYGTVNYVRPPWVINGDRSSLPVSQYKGPGYGLLPLSTNWDQSGLPIGSHDGVPDRAPSSEFTNKAQSGFTDGYHHSVLDFELPPQITNKYQSSLPGSTHYSIPDHAPEKREDSWWALGSQYDIPDYTHPLLFASRDSVNLGSGSRYRGTYSGFPNMLSGSNYDIPDYMFPDEDVLAKPFAEGYGTTDSDFPPQLLNRAQSAVGSDSRFSYVPVDGTGTTLRWSHRGDTLPGAMALSLGNSEGVDSNKVYSNPGEALQPSSPSPGRELVSSSWTFQKSSSVPEQYQSSYIVQSKNGFQREKVLFSKTKYSPDLLQPPSKTKNHLVPGSYRLESKRSSVDF